MFQVEISQMAALYAGTNEELYEEIKEISLYKVKDNPTPPLEISA